MVIEIEEERVEEELELLLREAENEEAGDDDDLAAHAGEISSERIEVILPPFFKWVMVAFGTFQANPEK